MLEDVLGWIVVLLVNLVLLIANIHILDPILSILISLYILYNILRNLRRIMALFLLALPQDMNLAHIEKDIQGLKGIESTYHLHA